MYHQADAFLAAQHVWVVYKTLADLYSSKVLELLLNLKFLLKLHLMLFLEPESIVLQVNDISCSG